MSAEIFKNKNYLRVFLSNLLLMGINNMVPSMFVLFLCEHGGTDMDAGIATYLYSLCSLIARPVAGRMLGTPKKRAVTLLSLALLGLFNLWYIAVPLLVFLIINRAFTGMLLGAASVSLTTNAYDTLPPEHFSEGVGYFGFSNAIATAVGPGFGLFLFQKGGAAVFFGVIAAMMAAALMLMRTFKYVIAPPKEKAERFRLRDIPRMFIEKNSLPAALMQTFCAMTSAIMSTYMVPFLAERKIGTAGLYFAFQATGTFISRLFLGKISDKYGEGPLVYMSVGLFSGGLGLIVFGPSLWCLALGGFMMGLAYGFTVTGLQIMSVRIVPPERRGTAAATYTCAWDIAASLGGLIGGILVTNLSYTGAFTCLLALFPMYFLSYFLFFRHHASAFKQAKRLQK